MTGGSNAKVDCVATQLQGAGASSIAERNALSSSEPYRKLSIEDGGWAGRRAAEPTANFDFLRWVRERNGLAQNGGLQALGLAC